MSTCLGMLSFPLFSNLLYGEKLRRERESSGEGVEAEGCKDSATEMERGLLLM